VQPIRKAIQQGFTFIELLVVVIALALLAVIVVTQFVFSTDDARLASLDSTLSDMRAAIDLYYQQHGEYPGELTAVDVGCTATDGTGTGGAGEQGVQAFLDQMSFYTDSNGGACSVKDANFQFGPYLTEDTLPVNPITASNALEVINAGNILMVGSEANLGWKFDIVAGKFIANDTTDPDGGGPLVSNDQR
jgi:prepilin-type N-terminal cleavage/methylation domain-containing protein